MESLLERLYFCISEEYHHVNTTQKHTKTDQLFQLLEELKAEKGYDYTETLYSAILDHTNRENTEAFSNGIRFTLQLLTELFPKSAP